MSHTPQVNTSSLIDAVRDFSQQTPPQDAAVMFTESITTMAEFFTTLAKDVTCGTMRPNNTAGASLVLAENYVLRSFKSVLENPQIASSWMGRGACQKISSVFAKVADIYDYSLVQAQTEQVRLQNYLSTLARVEWEMMQKPGGVLRVYGIYQGAMPPDTNGTYSLERARRWPQMAREERAHYHDDVDRNALGDSPQRKATQRNIEVCQYETRRSAAIARGLTQIAPALKTISALA